jgi:hypothetical protein
MKKFAFLVLFGGLVAQASAQELSLGVKGGLNVAKVTNTIFNDVNTRASVYLGGFARVTFNESWSVQPELFYSGQGFKYNVPILGEYKVRLNYINLPVMVQYHLIPEFYLEAGPQLGFMVASKNKHGNTTVDIQNQTKGVDFGLGFGLGYDFDFGLGINARYNFGLGDVYQSDGSQKNSVAQFGVYYTIGRFRK